MEVILVLDSDEEDVSAKGLAKGLAMKGPKVEEREVRIKKEPGVEHEMDSHSSTRRRRRLSSDSIESSSGETEMASSSIFYSDDVDEGPKWPQDYHVCDVASVFKKPPRGLSKKVAFMKHFPGLEFKKSTFYDNYNLWLRTLVAFRTKYADYGQTEKGSWKVFLTARARYLNKEERRKRRRVEKEKAYCPSLTSLEHLHSVCKSSCAGQTVGQPDSRTAGRI